MLANTCLKRKQSWLPTTNDKFQHVDINMAKQKMLNNITEEDICYIIKEGLCYHIKKDTHGPPRSPEEQ